MNIQVSYVLLTIFIYPNLKSGGTGLHEGLAQDPPRALAGEDLAEAAEVEHAVGRQTLSSPKLRSPVTVDTAQKQFELNQGF